MRLVLFINLLLLTTLASSQVYEEPPWLPPLPPPVEEYCHDQEKVSEPVISYKISDSCAIADVQQVGEEQYGTEQVKKEVMGLISKDMVRRYISGNFVFFNEVKIELHRALERPAALVCTVDMMGKKVIDAKITRQKVINEDKIVLYDEPVQTENNQLPNLGVFTYTSEIRYTINNCPE